MEVKASYEVCKGAMLLIKNGSLPSFETVGIQRDDFENLVADRPFTQNDRPRVVETIKMLLHGTTDMLGLPRIEVPVEYRAAVIAMFVSPINLLTVCRWCEDEKNATAEELIGGGSVEPCSARQLFALVLMASGSVSGFRPRWTKKVDKAVREAKGVDNEKVHSAEA